MISLLSLLKPKWYEAIEPPHDKTNKMACAPSEDPAQPGHPPSLIRVFVVRMKKAWVHIYQMSAQRRLWSDWADIQTDLSLRWAHSHFVGFVMRRLSCCQHTLIAWLVRAVSLFEVSVRITRDSNYFSASLDKLRDAWQLYSWWNFKFVTHNHYRFF